MYNSVQDLRCLTLQGTYLQLHQMLLDGKVDLKSIASKTDGDMFDQSIRLIIVDKAHMHDEVSRHLLSSNPAVIRRIIRCSWYFIETPNIFFIENVFPVVSVSTRLKVITALGKCVNKDRAEELYLHISREYGHDTAEPLLSSCGENLIRKRIFDDKKRIGQRAFVKINKRFPTVGIELLKLHLKSDWRIPPPVCKEIARKHPELLHLFSCDDLSKAHFKIGQKLLRSLLKTQMPMFENFGHKAPEIVTCSHKLLTKLSRKAQVSFLIGLVQKDESRFTKVKWLNALPEFKKYLRAIPAAEREILLQETFSAIYTDDLWQCTDVLDKKLLEMITSEKRAAILKNSKFQGVEYIYLWPADEAVPKLIQEVKRTPDPNDRLELVKQMIMSTRIEANMDLLSTVLEIAIETLDDKTAIYEFFNSMQFSNGKITESTWRHLVKITTVAFKADTFHINWLYPHEELIGRILSNGGTATDEISAWKTFVLLAGDRYFLGGLIKRPHLPHAKYLLTTLYEELPSLLKTLPGRDRDSLLTAFLETAKTINLNLSDLPDYGKSIFDFFDEVDYYHVIRMKPFCLLFSSAKMLKICANSDKFGHLFAKKPYYILDNLQEIMNEIFSSNFMKAHRMFFQSKRLLDFYGGIEEIAGLCEKAYFTDESSRKNKLEVILSVYSNVASLQKFNELFKTGLNESTLIKRHFFKCFINVRPIEDACPLVQPCLVGGGDFLYPALPTFHKICYTSNISFVVSVVVPLLDSAASVKKKAIRVISDVCTLSDSFKIFHDLWTRSVHYSVRSILLKCFLQIFLEDPNQIMWDNFRKLLLEVDDCLLVPALPSSSEIPDDFLPDFVGIVWKILEKFKAYNETTLQRLELLNEMQRRMHLLPDIVCQDVINHGLFTGDNVFSELAVSYLFRGYASLEHKLSVMLTVFNNRGKIDLLYVEDFVKCFIKKRNVKEFHLILKKFQSKFEDEFKSSKYLRSRLLLELADLSSAAWMENQYDQKLLVDVGRTVGERWRTLRDLPILVPLLVETLVTFFNPSELPAFLAGLGNNHPAFCIIAIRCLPHGDLVRVEKQSLEEIDWNGKTWNIYDSCRRWVLWSVRKCDDAAVQLYLANYLSDETVIQSCKLTNDMTTLEKVCKHFANHHRNDIYNHEQYLTKVLQVVVHRTDVSYDVWKNIEDIARIRNTTIFRRSLLRHASYLLSNRNDPTTFLHCWLNLDSNVNLRRVPLRLKKLLVSIIQERLIHVGSNEAIPLLLELVKENVPNLCEIIVATCRYPYGCEIDWHRINDVLYELWEKTHSFHGLLWFLKNEPQIIQSKKRKFFELCNYQCSWFRLRHLLSVFRENQSFMAQPDFLEAFKVFILEKLNDNFFCRNSIILLFVAVVGLGMEIQDFKSPVEEFLYTFMRHSDPSNCFLDWISSEEILRFYRRFSKKRIVDIYDSMKDCISKKKVIEAVIGSVPLKTAATLIKNNFDSPADAILSLRISFKYFVNEPTTASWTTLCQSLDSTSSPFIRRFASELRIDEIPLQFFPKMIGILWELGRWRDIDRHVKSQRNKFLLKFREELISYIPNEVRRNLFQIADEDNCQFIYFNLLQPNRIDFKVELLKKVSDQKFIRKFCNHFLKETQFRADCREAVEFLLSCSNILLEIGCIDCIYKLRILQLRLNTCDNVVDFAKAVVMFFQQIADLEYLFPFVVSGVNDVLMASKISIFDLVENMLPFCKSQVDFVICASMLPKNVPSTGPLIIDPNCKAYENCLEMLLSRNDSVIDAYVYRHITDRTFY